MPSLVLISKGQGIPGSSTPWSGYMVKPDFVFLYDSIIVVLEADEDDGHSGSKGNSISKWGTPWKYNRDLIAELSKMQTAAKSLNNSYQKNVLIIRCNSDHTSLRLVDTGLYQRVQTVIQKILNVAASTDLWPPNCFRLALIDMPPSRFQPGTTIHGSDDVFISWENIQQTIDPTPPEILKEITRQETEEKKKRRAARLSLD
jgi:hypothetical protein